MDNVKLTVKGHTLTIEVDLRKRGEASKSGKSVSIASTRGNVSVPNHDGVKLGLNVYESK